MAMLSRVDENVFEPQVILLAPNEELVDQISFQVLTLSPDNKIEAMALTRFDKSKQTFGFYSFIE